MCRTTSTKHETLLKQGKGGVKIEKRGKREAMHEEKTRDCHISGVFCCPYE